MQALRSLVYTTLFILVTAFFGMVVLLSALLSTLLPLSIEQRYVIPRYWGLSLTWLAGAVCGLTYVVEGQENLPKEPFISLWKHSSSWDTLAQMFVVPPAAWTLKREMLWIPIVGWAVRTYKPIAIDRSAGHSAVNQVVAQGRERLAAGMGIVVYPEGTRVLPGQTRKYGISGALLATKTGAPIVPIAHNSGYFWKRRSWMKYPGTIRVVIGKPIDPTGLEPREINARVQQWIEAAIAEMVEKPGGKPG
jgi:1-acyl-sn-glycerol-3-phosphate acyltransferase